LFGNIEKQLFTFWGAVFLQTVYGKNKQNKQIAFIEIVHSSKKQKTTYFCQKKCKKDLTFDGNECIIDA